MARNQNITADMLRGIFDYDSRGFLVWKHREDRSVQWNGRHAGKIAGTRRKDGYWMINIYGAPQYAHRLIYLFVHGQLPKKQIDHIGRNPGDNRVEALRPASHGQNNSNSLRRSRSGLKGAYYDSDRGLWFSQIGKDGVHKYLGSFATKEAAHAKYCEAARISHGEFARTE
jgi:hypothetical protein